MFTGGGTGGHLFPGLAVAERLIECLPEIRISFAGSGKPLETQHVAAAGFEYLPLPCGPWPRKLRDVVGFVVDNLRGYRAARRFLTEQRVTLVVGLGGYTSGPMARAAARHGIPLVLLEQNVVPGRVTRWLAPRAAAICTSFAQTREHLPDRCPVRYTGNPIRAGFRSASRRRRQLLILGGSSGARALNEQVPPALAQIHTRLIGWKIIHQTGQADLQTTRRHYRALGLEATVVPFVTDMPGILAETELAVCRAGGTTLAELAAAGVPAVLVPYPHAANDHQRRNAEAYLATGACRLLDEREAPGGLGPCLAATLAELLDAPQQRAVMARALRYLARSNAADEVALVIAGLLRGARTCEKGSLVFVTTQPGATSQRGEERPLSSATVDIPVESHV